MTKKKLRESRPCTGLPRMTESAVCLSKLKLRGLSKQIVAAYLSNNSPEAPLNLKDLETSVYDTLADCAGIDAAAPKGAHGEASPASRRAPRGKSAFRQRDLRAAISATEKAGKEVSGVEIDNTGTIKIVLGKPPVVQPAGANEWDAVFE